MTVCCMVLCDVVRADAVAISLSVFGQPICLQFLMVKELFMLARVAQQDTKIPGFRAQQWYFFFVATFYLYLR